MNKEILRLKKMLEDAKIPFMVTSERCEQIRLNKDIDVIQNVYSYGSEQNLLEIMGALTAEEMETDSVLGYLTAEEVFKRFKYCYENKTSIYVEVTK